MSEYKRLTGQKWTDDIDLKKEYGYSYIYKRLYELEDKIMEGTIIELPCKVGESVYAVNHYKYNVCGGYVSEEFVSKIHISYTILVETIVNGTWRDKKYLPEDFGDIVFTTKEAAEARLKELQEGKK